MARRLAPPTPEQTPLVDGEVPAEIAVGAVVGVWGDDLLEASAAYAQARRRWEQRNNLDRARSLGLVPARRPVDGEAAAERLRRLGLDVARLRQAAARWNAVD